MKFFLLFISEVFLYLISYSQETTYYYPDKKFNALDCTTAEEYINSLPDSSLSDTVALKPIYRYVYCNDSEYFDLHSKGYQYLLHHQKEFCKYFKKEQVEVRIALVAIHTAETAIQRQDKQLLKEATDILQQFETRQGKYGLILYEGIDSCNYKLVRINFLPLRLWMKFYRTGGNFEIHDKLEEQYVQLYKNIPEALCILSWDYVKEIDIPEKITKALWWSMNANMMDRELIGKQHGIGAPVCSFFCLFTHGAVYYKEGHKKEGIELMKNNLEKDHFDKLQEPMTYEEAVELYQKLEQLYNSKK